MFGRIRLFFGMLCLGLILGACSSSSTDGTSDEDVVFLPGSDAAQQTETTNPGGDIKPMPDGRVPDEDSVTPEDGSGEEDNTVEPGEFGIRIVEPSDGDTVTGSIRVRIEPLGMDELKLDSLSVYMGENWIFGDTKLPTEFILDTMEYADMNGFSLRASAKWGAKEAEDSLTVSLSNPDFRIEQVEIDRFGVDNGTTVGILVTAVLPGLQVAADFSSLDTTYQLGSETVQDQGDGTYLVTYTVGGGNGRTDGEYKIPLTVTNGTHTWDYNGLSVQLQNTPTLPVRVERGIFVSGALPAPSPAWVQPISLLYGNDFIITGGSAKVSVDFGGYAMKDEIVGILLAVDGFHGYYQVPLDHTTGDEELLLLMRTYLDNEIPPGALNLKVAVQDARGRVSPTKNYELSVQTVGNGDVQVSVSWDAETDIDLHVVEPDGCELYYGNKTCTSGGWLDLDSNPACMIDGINNENVFWPEGDAPLGTYIVRVDYYDDCGGIFGGGGHDTNATVTIHYCGFVEVYEEFFAKDTDDAGGQGDGKTIAEFNNEKCGRVLRGRVRYQDRTFDSRGFQAFAWKPVRFATVEVRRASDDEVVGLGYTDRMGNYEARFNNSNGAPGVYVRVKSVTNLEDGLRAIQVMNHPKFQQIYRVDSEVVDETSTDVPVVNIEVTEADGAGAFNIFDVVSGGYDLIRLMTGQDLGHLNVYWATGADTTSTIFCNDFFYENGICSEHMALSVQGKEIDRDEYDDMVILKEFFKFGLARTSRDDNPGGAHDGTRDDPRRSWSEGVSAFFACDVTGSRHYVNSLPFAVYQVLDLEDIRSPFAFGTNNGLQHGDISEYLVDSFLWDIADGNSESFDLLSGLRLPIYDSILTYMDHDLFADRGPDGVDLIDFLDGWFCRGWGDKDGLQQLLLHYEMAYDWDGPSGCFNE